MLSAFADRSLAADEARAVERHVSSCPSCSRVVAMVISSDPGPVVSSAPRWGWSGWRWAVPIATAATVAGLWVATTRQDAPEQPVESIAATPSASPQAASHAKEAEDARAAAPRQDEPPRNASPRKPEKPVARDERARETRQDQLSQPSASAQGSARVDVQASRRAEAAIPPAAPAAAPPPPAPLAETVTVAQDVLVSSPIPSIAWRVRGAAVERSTDGGATWAIDYTADRSVLAGAAVNGDVVWMVGQRGLVLRRSGSGWSVARSPTIADLNAVEAVGALEATIRAANGAGFHTVDGGATWTTSVP
jgi:hypothetical protein